MCFLFFFYFFSKLGSGLNFLSEARFFSLFLCRDVRGKAPIAIYGDAHSESVTQVRGTEEKKLWTSCQLLSFDRSSNRRKKTLWLRQRNFFSKRGWRSCVTCCNILLSFWLGVQSSCASCPCTVYGIFTIGVYPNFWTVSFSSCPVQLCFSPHETNMMCSGSLVRPPRLCLCLSCRVCLCMPCNCSLLICEYTHCKRLLHWQMCVSQRRVHPNRPIAYYTLELILLPSWPTHLNVHIEFDPGMVGKPGRCGVLHKVIVQMVCSFEPFGIVGWSVWQCGSS